jgi:hypothetical protein
VTPASDDDTESPEAAAAVPAILGDEFPDTVIAYRVQRRSLPVDWPDPR